MLKVVQYLHIILSVIILNVLLRLLSTEVSCNLRMYSTKSEYRRTVFQHACQDSLKLTVEFPVVIQNLITGVRTHVIVTKLTAMAKILYLVCFVLNLLLKYYYFFNFLEGDMSTFFFKILMIINLTIDKCTRIHATACALINMNVIY